MGLSNWNYKQGNYTYIIILLTPIKVLITYNLTY